MDETCARRSPGRRVRSHWQERTVAFVSKPGSGKMTEPGVVPHVLWVKLGTVPLIRLGQLC